MVVLVLPVFDWLGHAESTTDGAHRVLVKSIKPRWGPSAPRPLEGAKKNRDFTSHFFSHPTFFLTFKQKKIPEVGKKIRLITFGCEGDLSILRFIVFYVLFN